MNPFLTYGFISWLGLAASLRAQEVSTTIAEALDDPTGIWSLDVAYSSDYRGWLGVADAVLAHDGVDALRPVPFRRWWRPIPGVIILPPPPVRIQRQLPGAGAVSFLWRRQGDSYGYLPAECLVAGSTVASVASADWSSVHILVSGPAALTFSENPQNSTVLVDEFSYQSSPSPLNVTLDAPALTMRAVGLGQAWESSPESAPGAPPNGGMRLPPGVAGEIRLQIPTTGNLSYWTRPEGPGSAWFQTTRSVSEAPMEVVISRGYSDGFLVDGVSWVPSVPVSLAEALDTTLVIQSGGWIGLQDAALSADGVDAAIAQADSSFLDTTIQGPARVRFRAANPSGTYLSTVNFTVDGVVADTCTGGWSLREVIIRESGPHALRWSTSRGSRLDQLTVESLPQGISVSLEDGLDAAQVTYSHDPAADWSGLASSDAADHADVAVSPLLTLWQYPVSTQNTLEATFTTTETSVVSFQAKFDASHEGRFLLTIDGQQTSRPATGEWSETEFIVGAGAHRIGWLAVQNSREWSNSPPAIGYRRLMLDQLVITAVGGPTPAEALDYPHGVMAFTTQPVNVDTVMTHDGQDSLRFTLVEDPTALGLAPSQDPNEYQAHLWARTDAPAGTVTVNQVVLGSGAWIPLVVYPISLTIAGPAGAHVWVDEVRPLAASPVYDGFGSAAIDHPATSGEGYLTVYPGVAAHDGLDVFSGNQSSSDDNMILAYRTTVTGPATVSFWWRAQRRWYGWGYQDEVASAWVEVGGTLAATMDTRFAGPWRQASVQIPAGEQAVSVNMRGSDETTLFLDEFTVSAPNPAATYAGFMQSRGLAGGSADAFLDPDADGWPNLAEFMLNTDPSTAGSRPANPLTVSLDRDGGVFARLAGLNPATLREIGVDVEASADLTPGSWQSLLPDTLHDAHPVPPPYETEPDGTVTLPLTTGEIPGGKRFFRLKFRLVPPPPPPPLDD